MPTAITTTVKVLPFEICISAPFGICGEYPRPRSAHQATRTGSALTAPISARLRSPRSGGDGDHVPEGGKACERLALQLPHPLASQVELVADRLERPRFAVEAEAQLEDAPLALGERIERLAH